jgi:hypothetical protein
MWLRRIKHTGFIIGRVWQFQSQVEYLWQWIASYEELGNS